MPAHPTAAVFKQKATEIKILRNNNTKSNKDLQPPPSHIVKGKNNEVFVWKFCE